jgi:hypothetical protein
LKKGSVSKKGTIVVKDMIPYIQRLIADLTARKIGINITKTQAKQIDQRVTALLTSFSEFYAKVSETSNEQEKKIHLNSFFKVFAEYFFKIPSTDNYLDILIKQISDPFEGVVDTPLAHRTRYTHYRISLFNIIERLGQYGKYSAFKNFINTVPYEDTIILAQHTLIVNNNAQFLFKEYKTITEQLVEKYVQFYRLLSEHLELMIVYMYAAFKLIKGKSINYSEIKNYELRNVVNSLKTDEDFRLLLSPFNVIIRNSLSHGSKTLDPLSKKIIFKDRKERVSLVYSSFAQQTRELHASIYVISHLQAALNLYIFKKIREYLLS